MYFLSRPGSNLDCCRTGFFRESFVVCVSGSGNSESDGHNRLVGMGKGIVRENQSAKLHYILGNNIGIGLCRKKPRQVGGVRRVGPLTS